MLMLQIIGVLVVAFIVFTVVSGFNDYTNKHANYEFFTFEHSIAMVPGYIAIAIGFRMLNIATTNDDTTNGAIIALIGLIIVFMVIRNNFKQVSKKYAILGSIMQLVFYVPISIASIPIIVAVVRFGAQIRPVYSVNSRD